jgi:hypothetical protein
MSSKQDSSKVPQCSEATGFTKLFTKLFCAQPCRAMPPLSLGGLEISSASHCVCLSTEPQHELLSFEDIEAAAKALTVGIHNYTGRRLMSVPDARLQLNTAFHETGGAAAETQGRIPLCVGFSKVIAERFGVEAKLRPWNQKGRSARFQFRVLSEGPHVVFIVASSKQALLDAVAFLLAAMEQADGELVAIDHVQELSASIMVDSEPCNEAQVDRARAASLNTDV